MPRGPKGERRPVDVIGNAVHVMRVATGVAWTLRLRRIQSLSQEANSVVKRAARHGRRILRRLNEQIARRAAKAR
jgi:hypothetical protein